MGLKYYDRQATGFFMRNKEKLQNYSKWSWKKRKEMDNKRVDKIRKD